MNNETAKIIKQKQKPHNFKKWWSKNGYKVLRVIFFPIWITEILKDKISKYLYRKQEWSEERAAEILNYYIPRAADWDEEEKEFFLYDLDEMKYLKLKDRRFWFKFNNFPNSKKIHNFLIEKFELEGFTKTVEEKEYSHIEISFKLNEKGA